MDCPTLLSEGYPPPTSITLNTHITAVPIDHPIQLPKALTLNPVAFQWVKIPTITTLKPLSVTPL
ncbi:hypothetical protein OG21DRAFT_1490314 [Imleria badia]|nr:hypothetical protein OG21DRAFT_1490314 [Imleria badia]